MIEREEINRPKYNSLFLTEDFFVNLYIKLNTHKRPQPFKKTQQQVLDDNFDYCLKLFNNIFIILKESKESKESKGINEPFLQNINIILHTLNEKIDTILVNMDFTKRRIGKINHDGVSYAQLIIDKIKEILNITKIPIKGGSSNLQYYKFKSSVLLNL